MTTPLQPLGTLPAPAPRSNAGANTYTDVNGLAALKKDTSSPEARHAVAQQVDALFLQMMLKSMRDASAASGESDSNEMGMYQDMFDKQIALTMSQHQDLGLGALLTRQLTATASAAGPAMSSSGPATSPTGSAAPATSMGSTPAAASAATLLQSAIEFIDQVLPTIRVAARAAGLNPLGMLAQAALETGWGKRMARTADGAPSLNLFGIKADDSWGGARAVANTIEFSGGVATQRHAAFRAYGSIEDSVNDFVNLLKNSPRYRETAAAGADAQAYVKGIGQAGYATDPDYTNKLNEILNSSTLRTALNVSSTKL
jgi:flagellar protein FlgJ